VAGALTLGVAAAIPARAARNPYENVTERNLFGLKPPPAPPSPDELKAPPPDIKLTGITTILGNKRALLKTQTPARPPQPAKEESYILTEGQSEGDIEVIAIDDKAGVVKVNNHGKVQVLDFASNGVKPGGAPASTVFNGGVPPPPGPGGFRQIPPRIPRFPGQSAGGNASANSPAPSQPAADSNPGMNPQTQGESAGTSVASNGSVPQTTLPPPPPQTSARIEDSAQFTFMHSLANDPNAGDNQALLIEQQRAELLRQGRTDEAAMLPSTEGWTDSLNPTPTQ
jgi:hypothetical protein